MLRQTEILLPPRCLCSLSLRPLGPFLSRFALSILEPCLVVNFHHHHRDLSSVSSLFFMNFSAQASPAITTCDWFPKPPGPCCNGVTAQLTTADSQVLTFQGRTDPLTRLLFLNSTKTLKNIILGWHVSQT